MATDSKETNESFLGGVDKDPAMAWRGTTQLPSKQVGSGCWKGKDVEMFQYHGISWLYLICVNSEIGRLQNWRQVFDGF